MKRKRVGSNLSFEIENRHSKIENLIPRCFRKNDIERREMNDLRNAGDGNFFEITRGLHIRPHRGILPHSLPQPTYGSFLDLSNSLPRKFQLLTNLIQCERLLTFKTKIES